MLNNPTSGLKTERAIPRVARQRQLHIRWLDLTDYLRRRLLHSIYWPKLKAIDFLPEK